MFAVCVLSLLKYDKITMEVGFMLRNFLILILVFSILLLGTYIFISIFSICIDYQIQISDVVI